MKKCYWLIAAGGALLLAGCASPAPRKAYADLEKTVGQRMISPARFGAAGELAVKERTKVLLSSGALTADSSVELALLNNPSLAAEGEQIAVARANLAQESLLANPQIHYGLRRGGGENGYEFSALMDFMSLATQPLRDSVASSRYEQERLRVSQDILELAAGVKTAFYAAQAAE